jgi:hypothetical protein
MSGDRQFNPYAPPRPPPAAALTTTTEDGFEGERRSILVVLVLWVATLGLYTPIWLLRRRTFLDGLDASVRLSAAVPALLVVTFVVDWLLSMGGRPLTDVSRLLSIVNMVLTLFAEFRVARILRSEFRRSGRGIDVSSIAVFFFGILYLQAKINQGADTPRRFPKRSPE